MADWTYPKDGAEDTYINPRWIAVPVYVPDSIANCYITGTGVADFTDDPEWLGDRLMTFELNLTFLTHTPPQPGDSPIEPSDTVFADLASVTVGLAHIDHDTEGAPTVCGFELVSTEVKKVPRGETTLQFVVYGTCWKDVWIDRLAYEIDMLIYRPRFAKPDPISYPWVFPLGNAARVANQPFFRPGR